MEGASRGRPPVARALQEGHGLLSPTGPLMSVSYFKIGLIPLRQTDLNCGMMFQPPCVRAREALIHVTAELKDARSFLHIPIALAPSPCGGGFPPTCAPTLPPRMAPKVGRKVSELQTLTLGLHTAPWL